jgi:hypothetical protein
VEESRQLSEGLPVSSVSVILTILPFVGSEDIHHQALTFAESLIPTTIALQVKNYFLRIPLNCLTRITGFGGI